MAQVHNFGVADIQAYYDAWVQVDPIYRGLMIRNIDVPPFNEGWNDLNIPTMVMIASAGRSLVLGNNQAAIDTDRVYTVVMGELLGPMMRRDYFLEQDAARRMFINSIYAVIGYGRLNAMTLTTEESLGEYLEAARNEQQIRRDIARRDAFNDYRVEQQLEPVDPDTITQEALTEFMTNDRLAMERPFFPQADIVDPVAAAHNMWTATGEQRNIEDAVLVCRCMAVGAQRLWRVSGMVLLAHILVSVLKRGNTTRAFLDKVRNGIVHDLGHDVDWREECITMFFAQFGGEITGDNIREVVTHWQGCIPQAAIRMTILCQQAANTGLTTLVVIGRAFRIHPNFPWLRISQIYQDEWRDFTAAVAAVGNNPYYGYNKNLQVVKSTNYKSLGYVAKELLVRVSGEQSLTNYRGWPQRVAYQDVIDRMIVDYETQRGNQIAGIAGAVAPHDEPNANIAALRAQVEANNHVYV